MEGPEFQNESLSIWRAEWEGLFWPIVMKKRGRFVINTTSAFEVRDKKLIQLDLNWGWIKSSGVDWDHRNPGRNFWHIRGCGGRRGRRGGRGSYGTIYNFINGASDRGFMNDLQRNDRSEISLWGKIPRELEKSEQYPTRWMHARTTSAPWWCLPKIELEQCQDRKIQ